jgi:hypothetical protein
MKIPILTEGILRTLLGETEIQSKPMVAFKVEY